MCLATKASNLLATVVSHMSQICRGRSFDSRVGNEQIGCGRYWTILTTGLLFNLISTMYVPILLATISIQWRQDIVGSDLRVDQLC